MDCKKCHSQCKAACCGIFPMEKEFFESHKDKIVNEPFEVIEDVRPKLNSGWGEDPYTREKLVSLEEAAHVIPITRDAKCCFLNKDFSCNVYEVRPMVCRKFGDETVLMMTCVFQGKDGRLRSRQERRHLERQVMKHLDKLKVI